MEAKSMRKKVTREADPQLNPFDKMPDEVIVTIFSNLSGKELMTGPRLVCRRWKQLALDYYLWARITLNVCDHNILYVMRVLRLTPVIGKLELEEPRSKNIERELLHSKLKVLGIIVEGTFTDWDPKPILLRILTQQRDCLITVAVRNIWLHNDELYNILSLIDGLPLKKMQLDWINQTGSRLQEPGYVFKNITTLRDVSILQKQGFIQSNTIQSLLDSNRDTLHSLRLRDDPISKNLWISLSACYNLRVVKVLARPEQIHHLDKLLHLEKLSTWCEDDPEEGDLNGAILELNATSILKRLKKLKIEDDEESAGRLKSLAAPFPELRQLRFKECSVDGGLALAGRLRQMPKLEILKISSSVSGLRMLLKRLTVSPSTAPQLKLLDIYEAVPFHTELEDCYQKQVKTLELARPSLKVHWEYCLDTHAH